MAVRSCVAGATGRLATTTTLVMGALLGMLAAPATMAGQPWDFDPTPSVMVESGSPRSVKFTDGALEEFASDGGTASDGALSTDDSMPFVGGAACHYCNGAGCNECRKHAIFDVLGSHCHDKNACWVGRADALLLWRNAPPGGLIVDNPSLVGGALSAGGMQSTPAAGPRFSIFRFNKCTGNGIEATYLRAANFRSIRPLGPLATTTYDLPAPGIFGNTTAGIDSANANLGARVQSFELNRHRCLTECVRFLAGFRWIEWQEQFSMQTYNNTPTPAEYFQTNCFNDLYGGQIGLDANLFASRWIRVDSVVKAGAYYNVGVQSSQHTTGVGTAGVTANASPLSGAFAGEVGLTGVIPLTCCLDFRFGYFGLWLSGIAQPTQQLAGQTLPGPPAVGTINSNGGVLVQGVSLGLEGRW